MTAGRPDSPLSSIYMSIFCCPKTQKINRRKYLLAAGFGLYFFPVDSLVWIFAIGGTRVDPPQWSSNVLPRYRGWGRQKFPIFIPGRTYHQKYPPKLITVLCSHITGNISQALEWKEIKFFSNISYFRNSSFKKMISYTKGVYWNLFKKKTCIFFLLVFFS